MNESSEVITEAPRQHDSDGSPADKAAARKSAVKKSAKPAAKKTVRKSARKASARTNPGPSADVAATVESTAPTTEPTSLAVAAPVEDRPPPIPEAAAAPREPEPADPPPQSPAPGFESHPRPVEDQARSAYPPREGRHRHRRGDRRDRRSFGPPQHRSPDFNEATGRPHDRQDHHQRFERPPRPESVPSGPLEPGAGLLEISNKGFGFLRQRHRSFTQTPNDIFVTPEMVRRYGLRDGVHLEGDVRNGHRGPQMVELKKINGRDPDQYKNLPVFEELTAINPNKRIVLETSPDRTTTRIIDMVAPIGKGQRGLIVSPPRTGKTTLLQHIAEAIATKYPDIHLIVLLVDERPEEVTEITRAIPQAEVFASSNDQDPKSHLRMAQIAIERAKRLVEAGGDVFIVLDSITRLARAANNALKGGSRTMSGGIDARAMEIPRRLFAAARNTREAGSLTIIGTALVETNSKGDELIFQEFKGTGNMELVLDRKVAQQYVYPAVDIFKSGTRREELLLPGHQLEKINLIRRGLAGHKPVEAIERLLHFVRRHPNNAQMLLDIPKAAFIDG
jgi:transcription termination factor Rho